MMYINAFMNALSLQAHFNCYNWLLFHSLKRSSKRKHPFTYQDRSVFVNAVPSVSGSQDLGHSLSTIWASRPVNDILSSHIPSSLIITIGFG